MAWIEKSKDLVVTGKGVYNDIQANLIEIIKRALISSGRYHSLVGAAEFYEINPMGLSAVHVPGFFVWTDGSTTESKSAGGVRGNTHHHYKTYYATIQFLHGGSDQLEVSQEVREMADFIEEVITSNCNLNDLMNGGAEIKSIDFQPTPVKTNSKVVIAQGCAIFVAYKKTVRQKQSTR
jgi:hypothetical protein